MDFFSKNINDSFSKLRGLDLQELIYKIECYDLEYRDTLNLPKKLTFGTEIEYENLNINIVRNFVHENLKNWHSMSDASVRSGGEVVSPILTDDKKAWKDLKTICEFLKKNKANNNDRSGAHIHIGAHILNYNKEYWINFIKLYTIYESIMFRFFMGDKINMRGNVFEHARPIADILYECLPDLKRQKIQHFGLTLPADKYNSISFGYVKFYSLMKQPNYKNTLELRCPNGTIEEVIWQNNINTFAKLILKAKSDELDQDLLDYKLKNGVVDSEKKFYMYNEIRLKAALEFVDLIFNNNLDKIYFLKQYLKGFSDNYGVYNLTPAKKFVK